MPLTHKLSSPSLPPSFTAPPLFLNSSVSLTAILSLPVLLPCYTLPDPSLTFMWLFEGQLLDISSPSSGLEVLTDGTLYISSVTVGHEGMFTCIASNSLGIAQGFVTLDVLGG